MTQPQPNTPQPIVTSVPALIRHSHTVWRLLLENATKETIAVPLTDDTIECLVFRGNIGDVFSASGVSKSYYSPIRKFLMECGAITILERGTAHNPSLVVLDPDRPPPTVLPSIVKSEEERLTLAEEVGRLSHTVEVWETRLGGINIQEALRNFERRISRLESADKREIGESD